MLDTIVAYLHGARVGFRLASYPSEEALPHVAHPLPHGATLIDTEVILVDGRPSLACFPAGEHIDYGALSSALGGLTVAGDHRDLPGALASAAPPIPPFGQLWGMPLVVDEGVVGATIVMPAFGGSDFFEVSYEDWARLEAPRIASFASAGELEQETGERRATT